VHKDAVSVVAGHIGVLLFRHADDVQVVVGAIGRAVPGHIPVPVLAEAHISDGQRQHEGG
jgi:hypothetical protein